VDTEIREDLLGKGCLNSCINSCATNPKKYAERSFGPILCSEEVYSNFNFDKKDTILIDTIVEHFENHSDWIRSLPKNITVILQGNDMFDVPDHVNCHHSLEEFEAGIGLPNTLWSGELVLYKCTRFMAIGRT